MKKIVVAGSLIMDMSVKVEIHPVVGQTVIGNELVCSPGGKGLNQAVSAKRLSTSEVLMLGAVGIDSNSAKLQDFLRDESIVVLMTYSEKPTGIAFIAVDKNGDNNIIVVPGANDDFINTISSFEEYENDFFGIEDDSILIAQLETPIETTRNFFEIGRRHNTINIFNPAPAKEIPKNLLALVDIFIVNETELEFFTGSKIDPTNIKTIQQAINLYLLQNMQFTGVIIVTLGKNGVWAINSSLDEVYIPGLKVDVVDTAGAGDCFVGAIAAFIANNNLDFFNFREEDKLEEAIIFANKAASISVTKQGTAPAMPFLNSVTG